LSYQLTFRIGELVMEHWIQKLRELLKILNNDERTSHVTYNTAYDTAWVARLYELDQPVSDAALNWICENQLPDGCWGANAPFYYHDRAISTMAAMIALAKRGRRRADNLQIERGKIALKKITSGATRGLMTDPNGATVGFEMIMPTLLAEAESIGIINSQANRILGRLSRERAAKLATLKGRIISRFITAAFSAEMAGPDGKHLLDVDNLQEPNGSVAHSPSATAYFALFVRRGDKSSLEYLRKNIRDGGVPSTTPFNVFERAWIMWNVALIGNLDIETLALCKPHIKFLESVWKPGKGVSYAAEHILPDGDDTALTYEVLAKFGCPVDIEAVLGYEEAEHFRCYTLETMPSTSANVHVLGALRQAGFDITHPITQKVLMFLRKSKMEKTLWIDKWHASPYYTAAHVIIACAGYDNKFISEEVEWILSTQNKDGSWGYYMPTAEETAYCLQALSLWKQHGGEVSDDVLKYGVAWLGEHSEPPYPPLWIGKCLYCPEYVVRSSILSALLLAS
jgi:halimadienyl-diphosphate synthase